MYYWRVRDNGMFYGLFRRKVLEDVHLNETFGGDWLFIADVVSQGQARIVPGTFLHRSLGGMSATTEKQVGMFSKTGQFHRSFPFIGLALSAARNILKGTGGLKAASSAKRLALAAAVFLIICLRKGVTDWLGTQAHRLRSAMRCLLRSKRGTGVHL